MVFHGANSDDAILAELGSRMARIRLNRNLTQSELAREAGVSTRTLQRFEQDGRTSMVNFVRILRAAGLLANLAALVPEPVASPVQELKTRRKGRRRASRSDRPETKKPWTWGDEE
jgi:transcriptional regulator with XRE-family HTH domain